MSKQLNILRVKRKRDQDPLQALVLENNDTSKRSKKNSYYYKFARTEVDETPSGDQPILTIDESKKLIYSNERVLLPQLPLELIKEVKEPALSEDILSMIKEQESAATMAQQKHKKPVRRKHQKAEPIESYNSAGDYVYDIYFRDHIDDESKYEQLRIAYFTYDEDMFNFIDETPEGENLELLDDEDIDSNAEDYYQNDYPEDEDNDNNEYLDIEERRHLSEILDKTEDLVMSDDEDDGFEILHNKRRFSTKDYQAYKDGGLLDSEQDSAPINDTTQEGFDNLYDDFYGSGDEYYEGPTSFLDDGRVSDEDEAEFKRNYFFKNEEDDDLAIHRDKIFGKLEKMINQNH